MTDSPVLYKVENQVATITLNRPEVLNAFNEEVIARLTETFTRAGDDKNARVVVLRGNGKSFCAGGDINWMRKMADYTREENLKDAEGLARLFHTLNFMPKVTVAVVQGHAFGGGAGLTACCDIAIAEEGTQFCLPEVRIGLIPSVISPYIIAAIGERQARRYSMTAERIDSATAHRLGLVHELAPPGGLDAALEKIIARLMDGAPGAQARGKKLMLGHIAGRAVDDAMVKKTVEAIAEERASPEGKDGLSAFLNKTEPGWRAGKKG